MSEVLTPSPRSESLKKLNRDQQLILLFCGRIRSSLNTVITKRLVRYSEYFYKEHLLPYFKREEKYIFTLINNDTVLLHEAMDGCRKLTRLFEKEEKYIELLLQIVMTLEKHIRLEQRIVLKELQRLDPDNELPKALTDHGVEPEEDNREDKFRKH